jgi:hypothetical protein
MRIDRIRELQADPQRAAVHASDLSLLRAFLHERYDIRPGRNVDSELAELCDDPANAEVALQLLDLQGDRTSPIAGVRDRADQVFYDLISREPLLGTIHSSKWTYIFDVAAYLQSLCQLLEVSGTVADLGCHVGYHPAWLAERIDAAFVGVDRSSAAIDFARRSSRLSPPRVGRLDFHAASDHRYIAEGSVDLLISCDGSLDWTAKHLRAAKKLLTRDGLIVWFGDWPSRDGSIGAVAEAAGLHLLHADSVGGWTGDRFEARIALIVGTRMIGEAITDPESVSARVWDDGFRDFCNSGRHPKDFQTLGYYRSLKR